MTTNGQNPSVMSYLTECWQLQQSHPLTPCWWTQNWLWMQSTAQQKKEKEKMWFLSLPFLTSDLFPMTLTLKQQAKQVLYEQRHWTSKELEHMLNFKYRSSYIELKKKKVAMVGQIPREENNKCYLFILSQLPLIYSSRIFWSRVGMLLFYSFGWILLPWICLVRFWIYINFQHP